MPNPSEALLKLLGPVAAVEFTGAAHLLGDGTHGLIETRVLPWDPHEGTFRYDRERRVVVR